MLAGLLICGSSWAAETEMSSDPSARKEKKEKKEDVDENGRKIKTGWNFGILPSLAYDVDKGFQYGVLTNIYDYGDGKKYPAYRHSLYAEASWTTKKNGNFRLYYQTDCLIPKHWFAVDISFLPDAMFDFYGFNGYQSVYNYEWSTAKVDDPNYLTRAFYKRKSNLFRTMVDISGTIVGDFKWNAGIGVLGFMNGNVDLSKTDLPDNQTELYKLYKEWGLISADEDKGGWHPYLRAGLTYDSRSAETNPDRGIYADGYLTYTAGLGQLSSYNYVALNLDFRHYVNIVKNRLNLAYRLCTQNTIAGSAPYYMNNYVNNIRMTRNIFDGLGGKNTLRGILRNRILSDGFAYATVELRSKLWFFDIGRQHFYLGLTPFFDAGMVTQPRRVVEEEVRAAYEICSLIPESETSIMAKQGKEVEDFFDFKTNVYTPHMSAGLGLRIAMNENFVLSVDWAVPFNKYDNQKMSNLYIGVGYAF